ncbi:hypothetical protein AYO21_09818 [Fonsecaea monophora]|uniref:Uncharacterized protein n=1 Tax=Fonsecaea monophora TaxID=254056 RepID=A0A177EVH5_9EURO|nr:hypothetical protein AYO21_09818 [Fonsecaea monophora]OAG36025.1 hypothetical protein AYO21_09818 [Fonsecaea monophora]
METQISTLDRERMFTASNDMDPTEAYQVVKAARDDLFMAWVSAAAAYTGGRWISTRLTPRRRWPTLPIAATTRTIDCLRLSRPANATPSSLYPRVDEVEYVPRLNRFRSARTEEWINEVSTWVEHLSSGMIVDPESGLLYRPDDDTWWDKTTLEDMRRRCGLPLRAALEDEVALGSADDDTDHTNDDNPNDLEDGEIREQEGESGGTAIDPRGPTNATT